VNEDTFIKTGRRVIDHEAAALSDLSSSINTNFSAAVSLIAKASGKIIISGMGKSGHVAKKIAATFSSTGTPSHFVHPAEASHGDLGMIMKNDAVIILSNSGETAELANLIFYLEQLQIPFVGISQNANSTLIRKASVPIMLPQLEEACNLGIVPTTSTTMALALGDALAITLMEYKKFSPKDFSEFHPGGSLGSQLLRVEDIMHVGNELPLVNRFSLMPEALITMSQKGFGIIGIINDDNSLLGVITDGDLRRNMVGLLEMTAEKVMTTTPTLIKKECLATDALSSMHSSQITCVFIVSSTKPVGILHIHDCLRAQKK